MQEKKEIKISLRTTIILCIIFVIILLAMFYVIITKNGYSFTKGNEETSQESSQMQGEKTGISIAYKDSDFSINFLKMENNKENMVYSPLSIKYALKMLNEGANGNTKAQIEKVIGNLDVTKYNNIDKVLSLANGIYIRDTYSKYVKESYTQSLINKYNADIKYDSFKNASNVNNWIENKTLGIIKNILQDETVQDPNCEMLLINALAIDMKWKNPFETTNTYGEEFYLENGNKVNATMLHKEAKGRDVSYFKDKGITALRMDLEKYDDTELEFVAIMPEANLSSYIDKFTLNEFNNIINKTKQAYENKSGINITIPKFSFEYNLKLKEDLIKLGITDAFKEEIADFSNMSTKALFVGDAIHKAKIDFTESGIKAAAVTIMLMKDTAFIKDPVQPEEIKINKPFLYVIRDKNTGEIWFIGTVYEPNLWDNDKTNYEYR